MSRVSGAGTRSVSCLSVAAGDVTVCLPLAALLQGMQASCKGRIPLSPMLADSIQLLANPFVAAALGLLLAAMLFLASRASFKLMTPERMETGMALTALLLFGRLALATGALWAYKSFVPAGIKPFAMTFAGGFLVMYTVELVRYAGLHKHRRPASAGQ